MGVAAPNFGVIAHPLPNVGVRLSTLVFGAAGVLFFTAFDGLARFGALPSLVWLLGYFIAFMAFLSAPARIIGLIVKNWPVFVIPVLAILSSFWSVAPMRTPIAGMQLFMTVIIAVQIASVLSTKQLMAALFVGQGFGLALSLVNIGLGIIPAYNPLNGTLIGIYGHKTAFGYSAILSCFALIAYLSYVKKSGWGVVYAVALMPLVIATQSASALIGYSAICLLLVFLVLRQFHSIGARRWMLCISVLALGLCLGAGMGFSGLFDDALAIFGKSGTLTGRTILWAMAVETWQESPIVGIGFSAFWHSETYAQDVNFIHSYVDHRLDGFHSAFFECAVALGAVGLLALICLLGYTLWRLGVCVFVTLSRDAMIWLSLFLTFVLMTMSIQDVGFKQHSGNYLLMVFCYLYAGPRKRSQA